MSHQRDDYVTCPVCLKQCRDFTPEAEFIGWHGECVECFLTRKETPQ